MSLAITIISALIVAGIFIGFQFKYFSETGKLRLLFEDFFKKKSSYGTFTKTIGGEEIMQLKEVGEPKSDLNNLIGEINHYIEKTKGTTDFSVIQNKVERKLNMRYDQSVARLSFPTYIGLMGTFCGVFMGILMFLFGFDNVNGISDAAIRNLLIGVLVSMGTSLVGLLLTTCSTANASGARKKIEEEKNIFYDFVQTELMPSLDVSMVAAITKLHETVDKFEPAFDKVINRFQNTFDRCTKAFGEDFEKHVNAVSDAVSVMGQNMDKINENIRLQEMVLSTLKSDEIVRGLDKYIEAGNRFMNITRSLDKFEEARRMMLAAAQESIAIQNKYNDSLRVPREIALKINSILDRLTTFEQSVKDAGKVLNERDILGNQVIESIQRQVQGISKKSRIADRYLEIADGKLEDLFRRQTEVLDRMNDRYKQAIEGHIEGFETMIKAQTEQLELQHGQFVNALKEKFNVEDIREEFTNLRKLELIEKRLSEIISKVVQTSNVKDIQKEIKSVQVQLKSLKTELESINENTKSIDGGGGGLFGWVRR
jgi:hypothetical protein